MGVVPEHRGLLAMVGNTWSSPGTQCGRFTSVIVENTFLTFFLLFLQKGYKKLKKIEKKKLKKP